MATQDLSLPRKVTEANTQHRIMASTHTGIHTYVHTPSSNAHTQGDQHWSSHAHSRKIWAAEIRGGQPGLYSKT